MHTLFADTMLSITLDRNLVRIDLGTTAVTTGEGQQERRATPTQQLVMPLDGFVRAFGLQENLIRKLIAGGVLKAGTAAPSLAGVSTRSH